MSKGVEGAVEVTVQDKNWKQKGQKAMEESCCDIGKRVDLKGEMRERKPRGEGRARGPESRTRQVKRRVEKLKGRSVRPAA